MKKITEADRKILEFLSTQYDYIWLAKHAKKIGITRQTLTTRARKLAKVGILLEKDGWRGRRVYMINPDFRLVIDKMIECFRTLERVI